MSAFDAFQHYGRIILFKTVLNFQESLKEVSAKIDDNNK